jgi:DNA polymerase III delta prime subunit
LLKILEEPPPATHLVLLATDASKLLDTIRSRCQVVRFRPLSREDLLAVLEDRAARGEPLERARFDEAARAAEGSVGRALEFLSESESLDFDWEGAPLSELLAWCDQFGRPRLGREAAADVLKRLLARFREEALEGRRPPEDMDRVLAALTRVRKFAGPSLALTALFLRLRRERKRRT